MSTHKAGTLQGTVLVLPVTLTVMGAVLLAPIMPRFMEAFGHVSNAHILVPILISIPALCIALFAPLAGILADKFGRRQMLIVSMLAYAIFGMAPLLMDQYYQVLLSRIGVGICEAIIITCSTTLIGDYFSGQQRDKWLGSQAALATVSAMVLFPLAGALGAKYGWQGPFAIYGVSLVLMVGVMLFTWDTQPDDSVGGSLDQTASASDTTVESFPWRHILQVCAFTLIGGMMFYVLQFQMGNALAAFNLDDPAKTGMFLSISSIGVPLGAVLYRYIKRSISLRTLITLEFALLSVGFLGMSFASSPQMLVATGFINLFGAGLLLPTMLTWAVSELSFSIRGKGTGIWQSTFAVGQFLSSISFALILNLVTDQDVLGAFQVYAWIALFMIPATMVWVKSSQRIQVQASLS